MSRYYNYFNCKLDAELPSDEDVLYLPLDVNRKCFVVRILNRGFDLLSSIRRFSDSFEDVQNSQSCWKLLLTRQGLDNYPVCSDGKGSLYWFYKGYNKDFVNHSMSKKVVSGEDLLKFSLCDVCRLHAKKDFKDFSGCYSGIFCPHPVPEKLLNKSLSSTKSSKEAVPKKPRTATKASETPRERQPVKPRNKKLETLKKKTNLGDQEVWVEAKRNRIEKETGWIVTKRDRSI